MALPRAGWNKPSSSLSFVVPLRGFISHLYLTLLICSLTPQQHTTLKVSLKNVQDSLCSARGSAAAGDTRFPIAARQDGRGERKGPNGWQRPLCLPSLRGVNWTMHSPAHWMQPSKSVSQSKPFPNKNSKHCIKVILTVLVKGVGVYAGVLRTSLASRGCLQPFCPLPALPWVFF